MATIEHIYGVGNGGAVRLELGQAWPATRGWTVPPTRFKSVVREQPPVDHLALYERSVRWGQALNGLRFNWQQLGRSLREEPNAPPERIAFYKEQLPLAQGNYVRGVQMARAFVKQYRKARVFFPLAPQLLVELEEFDRLWAGGIT